LLDRARLSTLEWRFSFWLLAGAVVAAAATVSSSLRGGLLVWWADRQARCCISARGSRAYEGRPAGDRAPGAATPGRPLARPSCSASGTRAAMALLLRESLLVGWFVKLTATLPSASASQQRTPLPSSPRAAAFCPRRPLLIRCPRSHRACVLRTRHFFCSPAMGGHHDPTSVQKNVYIEGITNYRDQLQDRFLRKMRSPKQVAYVVGLAVVIPGLFYFTSQVTLGQEMDRRRENMKKYVMPESRKINNHVE